MPTEVLKYSKKELMHLLNSSPTIALLAGELRDAISGFLPKANPSQLADLFAILRDERLYLDKLDADFNNKLAKAVDSFVVELKGAVSKMKRAKVKKAEKKVQVKEKKKEKALLKKLSKL